MRSASISVIFLVICILNLHCHQGGNNNLSKKLNIDTAGLLKQNDSTHKIIGDTIWTWVDTIVINYIKNTRNELISLARKDTARLEWYKEIQQRNGIKYIVVEIATTFEHRLIPRSWLYIDSTTRKVYENDITNDSLIKPR